MKTEGTRRELDRKWGECGMGGVQLWGWLMNPGIGRAENEESRMRAVRCANWAVKQMMRLKDEGGGCDGEDEREVDAEGKPDNPAGGLAKQRGSRGGSRAKKSLGEGEVCFLEQKVNVTEIRARMEAEGDARVRKELEGILRKQARSVLSVEYGRARQGEGRWYARGCAQLQSCKRETRKAALCGVGWEVDLRAAYPTLMLAKAEKIGEQRRQWCELERSICEEC